ncbi:MAG TPA: DUF5990 family protein [Acidimicrobiia bacterium]|nr:DUF5990 family protein [Acidimicrobiia bacterium]
MRVVIRGRNLPGRAFVSDGEALANVHVALQVRREPSDPVRADASSAEWSTDVRVVTDSEGRLDFRGPAVHGRAGDRFLYLTWGDVGNDGSFTMFRRAKLVLHQVDDQLARDAERHSRPLIATVDLTDEHGCPRCARVDPPAVMWSLG